MFKKPRHFYWKTHTSSGTSLEGIIQAPHQDLAFLLLKQKHIVPDELRVLRMFRFQKIKMQTTYQVLYILSRLLQANMSVITALQTVRQMQHIPKMSFILSQIILDIEKGHPIAHAFAKHSELFSNFFCQLLHVGEQTGTLSRLLCEWSDHQREISHLKKKYRQACFYPMILCASMLTISLLFIFIIMPKIFLFYHELAQPMPLSLQHMNILLHGLRQHWKGLCSIMMLAYISLRFSFKRRTIMQYCQQYALKVPGIGSLIQSFHLAHLYHTLGLCLSAGLTLTQACTYTLPTLEMPFYQQFLQQIFVDLQEGYSLSQALQRTRRCPPLVLALSTMGEEANTLTQTFFHIAHELRTQCHDQLQMMQRWQEPIFMVILGLGISLLLRLFYLPLFQLGDLLSC